MWPAPQIYHTVIGCTRAVYRALWSGLSQRASHYILTCNCRWVLAPQVMLLVMVSGKTRIMAHLLHAHAEVCRGHVVQCTLQTIFSEEYVAHVQLQHWPLLWQSDALRWSRSNAWRAGQRTWRVCARGCWARARHPAPPPGWPPRPCGGRAQRLLPPTCAAGVLSPAWQPDIKNQVSESCERIPKPLEALFALISTCDTSCDASLLSQHLWCLHVYFRTVPPCSPL